MLYGFETTGELLYGWTGYAHIDTTSGHPRLVPHFRNQWTFWARGQHLPTIPATGGGPLNGLQLTLGLYRCRPSHQPPFVSKYCVYANATRCTGPRTPIPEPPVANYSFGRRFCLPLPFCLTPPTPDNLFSPRDQTGLRRPFVSPVGERCCFITDLSLRASKQPSDN